uniref:Uncharacterized protein n=1 Tax=Echeneis naucrates TaxID=173247 RepID=A0A665UY08_ECHNA
MQTEKTAGLHKYFIKLRIIYNAVLTNTLHGYIIWIWIYMDFFFFFLMKQSYIDWNGVKMKILGHTSSFSPLSKSLHCCIGCTKVFPPNSAYGIYKERPLQHEDVRWKKEKETILLGINSCVEPWSQTSSFCLATKIV